MMLMSTLNLEKSSVCLSEIKYLDYVVNSKDLQTDPEKVQAIHEYPAPVNLRQLRRFLGMVGG